MCNPVVKQIKNGICLFLVFLLLFTSSVPSAMAQQNQQQKPDYKCAKDFNQNGEIEENEIASCIETQEGQLCPLEAEDCNLPTGDWVPINGTGISKVTYSGIEIGIELQNGNIRIFSGNKYGDWIPLCPANSYFISETEVEVKKRQYYGIRTYKRPASLRRPSSCRISFYKKVVNLSGDVNIVFGMWIERVVTSSSYNNGTSKAGPFGIEINNNRIRVFTDQYTCPLGDYPCMSVNGKKQCSPNVCIDINNPNNIEDGDTNQETPYPGGGQIDENGNCQGQIYIFPGQGLRCRKAGTQTGFKNCCNENKGYIAKTGLDESKLLLYEGASIAATGAVGGPLAAAAALVYSIPNVLQNLQRCNETDVKVSILKKSGFCHYVGEKCIEKWKLGFRKVCVQKAKRYCCFNSKLARIIHEQGRKQLDTFNHSGDWGNYNSPNCRGFTPEEFQALDFSQIDLSEYIQDIQEHIHSNFDRQQLQNDIQNKVQDFYNNVQQNN